MIIVSLLQWTTSDLARKIGKVCEVIFIHHNVNNASIVAAQSVATFVKKEDFTAVNSKNPREGYRIVLREKALWHSIQNLAGAANLDHYRFWTNKIISDSSGYYIGNGLVVTAGHVIIGSASVEAKTTEKWRVVFGLTEEYCRPDQQQSYPAEKMFILDE